MSQMKKTDARTAVPLLPSPTGPFYLHFLRT